MTESPSLLDEARAWNTQANDHPLRLYAIVDAAQNTPLWQRLAGTLNSAPLLTASKDSLGPHLVALGESERMPDTMVAAIARAQSPDLTLFRSPFRQDELQEHFHSFLKARLPDGIEMLLAFWDPAILAALVGQEDDDTLHVKGPVLTPEQKTAFLGPIAVWWYRDRENAVHRIDGPMGDFPITATDKPLALDQAQEGALIEAGVPDQLLYHLETNRPTLFNDELPHHKRYRFVRAVLPSARQLGLLGMRDLTNFVALCLIYRQRIQTDPEILQLLDHVQRKLMSFDEALAQMPE